MEKKSRLQELYDIARVSNLASSKSEFAALIGIDGATLSHALKDDGRVSVPNTIQKAEHALMKAGVSISAGGDAAGGNLQKNFDNISNPDVKEIVKTLVDEMAAQRNQLMNEMAAQRHDFMELLKTK